MGRTSRKSRHRSRRYTRHNKKQPVGKNEQPVGKTQKIKKRFRKSNCHPSIKIKKDAVDTNLSCLNPKSLQTIKTAFNRKHPEYKIASNNPIKIWRELQEKIPKCETETCWLDLIPDFDEKQEILKHFAPEQPIEWKRDKNAWLSNFDIDRVLQQYEEAYPEFVCLGPTPIDFDHKNENGVCVWEEICKLTLVDQKSRGKTKIGFIFNLDNSKGPGTHWVSMFCDFSPDTNGKPFVFYFDSTSVKMPNEVAELIQRLQTEKMGGNVDGNTQKFDVYENLKVAHQKSNTECGMYSLFFVITCLTRKLDGKLQNGGSAESKLSNSDLIQLFAGNTRIPDEYVENYRGKYFNA